MNKYYSEIFNYLTTNGESGVNDIAKGCDLPLSTVQRYLSQQTYFKKTLRRKWDLPEKVTDELVNRQESTRLGLLGSSLETQAMLVGSQLDEVRDSYETMLKQINAMQPLLLRQAPVASNSNIEIDGRLSKLQEDMALIPKLIKQHIDKIPEEYHEILKSVDWIELTLDKGREFFAERVSNSIAELITSDTEQLPDDVLIALEGYTK